MHRISEIHINPVGRINDSDDLLSLVKVFERRKENSEIVSLLSRFEASLETEGRGDIFMRQALAAKRLSDFDTSVPIWQKVALSGGPEGFWAHIELAKYYEHRAQDPRTALDTALAARSLCPPQSSVRADLDKRIKRLQSRLDRQDKSK